MVIQNKIVNQKFHWGRVPRFTRRHFSRGELQRREVLTGGPQLKGNWKGEELGSCTDCRRYWGELRAGTITLTSATEAGTKPEKKPWRSIDAAMLRNMALRWELLRPSRRPDFL